MAGVEWDEFLCPFPPRLFHNSLKFNTVEIQVGRGTFPKESPRSREPLFGAPAFPAVRITASFLSSFPLQQNTKALELALGRGTGAIYSSSRCVLPPLLLQTGSTLFSQGLICTGGLYKQLFLAHFHTAGISRGKNVPVNTAAAHRQQSWQQLRRLELGILGELGKDVPKIQLQKPSRAAGCRQRRAIISFHAILLLLKKP